jgi:hypothetical protein
MKDKRVINSRNEDKLLAMCLDYWLSIAALVQRFAARRRERDKIDLGRNVGSEGPEGRLRPVTFGQESWKPTP